MKITLKNSNSSKHYKSGEFSYNLQIVERGKELIFLTEDGKEIGSIKIEVMEKDDEKPTKNYWLTFDPVLSQTSRNSADVFVD